MSDTEYSVIKSDIIKTFDCISKFYQNITYEPRHHFAYQYLNNVKMYENAKFKNCLSRIMSGQFDAQRS